jgi:hypothetical protein
VALSGARGTGSWPSRAERTARLVALALVVLSLAAPPALLAQLHGQHWDVTPEGSGRARVGDPVTIVFRVRLDERDLLFDTIPRPAAATPSWVRVISVEKLQRQPDRIFTGRARVAFYRPGRQPVPVFELPFMRSVKGLSRGTLSSDSATVEIVPVVTDASSATLRDIKEPAGLRSPDPLELLLGLAALAAAGWLAWRSRRRLPVAVPVSAPAEEATAFPDPYETALDRLAAVEGAGWATVDVARHYDAVADVLRDYLEAHGVPARERTTGELRWALPPALLAGGTLRRFEQVFEEADLVKFAHWRPDGQTAVAFLAAARELLARWQAVHAGAQVGRGAER